MSRTLPIRNRWNPRAGRRIQVGPAGHRRLDIALQRTEFGHALAWAAWALSTAVTTWKST